MDEKEQLVRLGELLIEEGVITHEELTRALEESGKTGSLLAKALLAGAHVRREDLAMFLARTFSVPKFSLKDFPLDPEMANLVPAETARKHEMVPLARLGSILCVGKANYYNKAAVIELRRLTGLKVKVLLCAEDEVAAAIERLYAAPQPRPLVAPQPVLVGQVIPPYQPTKIPPPQPTIASPTPIAAPVAPAPAVTPAAATAPTKRLSPPTLPAQPAAVASSPTCSQPAPAHLSAFHSRAQSLLIAALGSSLQAIQIATENTPTLKELSEKRPDQVLQVIASSLGTLSAVKIR